MNAAPTPAFVHRLPETFQGMGPYGLAWWQWSGLAVITVGGILTALLVAWLTRKALAPLVKRTPLPWDDALLARAQGPLALGWFILIATWGLQLLELRRSVHNDLATFLRILVIVALFWSVMRLVSLVADQMIHAERFENHAVMRSLVPLAARVAAVLVFALMVVSILALLGYPVASAIAGLGIGGLAVALAAQKTLENFFGSLSIAGDRPFRVGDYVRFEGNEGTIEAIGLRSTRVRTQERTVITLPNGKLSDSLIENFELRDKFRFAATLGLVYGTSAAQLRTIVAGCEEAMRSHPAAAGDAPVARFGAFGESALRIDIQAWFRAASYDEFRAVREQLLFRFMEVVEQAGTSFAFPTRTVHLAGGAPPAG